MWNKRLQLIASLVLAAGCGSPPPPVEPGAPTTPAAPIEIRTYGSLADMFDRGATRPVVSLASIKGDANLVGLGSLSGLRGEVAILPGQVWTSIRREDGSSAASLLGPADDTAAFLVTSSVPAWQPVPLAEDVDFGDLPDALEELAKSAGIDVERPFPLLIDGALANLEFNVVDGRSFPTGVAVTREEVMVAAAKGKYPSVQGTIVGFYAKSDHPEFLHPGTRVHLHVIVPSHNQMGHVDRVDLPRGATVRFPVPR